MLKRQWVEHRVAEVWRGLWSRLSGFGRDEQGQILIVFALSSLGIFAGLGAGMDLATAFAARQRLSEVATLACQYSTRPSVAQTATSTYNGPNGFQTYVSAVNAFAATSLTAQHWSAPTPTGTSGQPGQYFTATAATGGTSAASQVPSNPVVEMNASIPTAFGKILNLSAIPVHARIACQTLATTPQIVNPPLLLQEGFEKPCSGYCNTQARGGTSFTTSPLNTFPNAPQYVGVSGFSWYLMGYCLETDSAGVISPTVPENQHSAELDCDNGYGNAGNSSISTKLYLEAGSYELRYFYRSRVAYPDYNPAYICGTTAADVGFADSANSSGGPRTNVVRSNQINVYLDQNTSGSAPLHTTVDGTQQLAGSNLIDVCVHSTSWIERSVRVSVSTPGYYWLSFAADGESDSFGGQLDFIRFCQGMCTGALQDNFPVAWTPGGNGGVNKVLFQDGFDTPSYTANATQPSRATNGDPSASQGTSGSASGWPGLAASGWQAAPANQITYGMAETNHNSQFIWLDGSGGTTTNRIISRQFLLDPGYYRVSYDYVAEFSGYYGTTPVCYEAPTASGLYPTNAATGVSGTVRDTSPVVTLTRMADTNIVGVFMSDASAVSVPNGKTIGSSPTAAPQGQQTGYFNPGSPSTSVATPSVAPDAVNWQNYTPGQINPVISTCAYTGTAATSWTTRTANIKITKPGMYLLSFSSQSSSADGYGAGLDNITLTALGSPFMTNPPGSALTKIPTAAPASDSSLSLGTYSGFKIAADPFAPPAAPP